MGHDTRAMWGQTMAHLSHLRMLHVPGNSVAKGVSPGSTGEKCDITCAAVKRMLRHQAKLCKENWPGLDAEPLCAV